MSTLKERLAKLSPEQREKILAKLREQQPSIVDQPQSSIPLVSRNQFLPLSYGQEMMWFWEQLYPDNSSYNLLVNLYIEGPLNKVALKQSFGALIQRHESLRTSFKSQDGKPVQHISEEVSFSFSVNKIDELSNNATSTLSPDQQVILQKFALQYREEPFDLTQAPLLRATLIQVNLEHHILLLTLHHIVYDGWSLEILARELSHFYRCFCQDHAPSLPALPIQYADFAHWQRQWLTGDVLDKQLQYWKQQLAGMPPLLALPSDRPRPLIKTLNGRAERFELDRALTDQLKQLGQQSDAGSSATLSMTLMAAFFILLHRYTGVNDLVVGSAIANRTRVELEPLIGLFTNLQVLRANLSGQDTFQDCLKTIRRTARDAYAHQDLPFEQLVEALQPERDPSYNPLVQVIFVLQNSPAEVWDFPGLTVRPQPSTYGAIADLEVHLWETPTGLGGDFAYNTDLFDSATIIQMMTHFRSLLTNIVAHPQRPIVQLSLLSAIEKQAILAQSLITRENKPLLKPWVYQVFEEQVEMAPEAIALIANTQSISYSELNGRANRLAHTLIDRGIAAGAQVGIYIDSTAPPTIEQVVGIVGVLKTGAAYVPLEAYQLADGSNYSHKLSAILSDISAAQTVQHLLATSPSGNSIPVVIIGDLARLDPNTSNPVSAVMPTTVAYVLDGFSISHSALSHRLARLQTQFPLQSQDGVLHKASLASDVAVAELWLALCQGGRVVIPTEHQVQSPAELYGLIGTQQVAFAHLWPTELKDWLSITANPMTTSWQWVLCSGEYFGVDGLDAETLQGFGDRFGVKVTHCYSLPEAGGEITDGDWQRASEQMPLSVGRPGPLSVYVLDRERQLMPIGVQGDLYIGGPRVADLSCGPDPRLLEEAGDLISDDYAVTPCWIEHPEWGRLLATGDQGRRHRDGHLELLGNGERQVWIRGRRVSLGRIESALLSDPSIDQAYVLVRQGELVAYVVAVGPWVAHQVAERVQSQLPPYLQPMHYVPITSLPLTTQGTVDEKALLEFAVIDSQTQHQWEQQLSELSTVDQVAVVRQPVVRPIPPLHLFDVLSGDPSRRQFISSDASGNADDSASAEMTTNQPQAAIDETTIPALSEGPPLEWDRTQTLAMVLEQTARDHGDTPITYIRADGTVEQQSYGQLWQDAQRVLGGLRRLGLKPQDKVMFQLEDNREFIIGFWGCILGGFIPVPVSIPPNYAQEHSSLTKLHNTWEMLDHPLVLASDGLVLPLQQWSNREGNIGLRVQSLEPLLNCDADDQYHIAQPDDLVLLLLTSGSTGLPKAVMHSHQTLISRCVATATLNHFDQSDISLNWFPLDHVGGIVMFHLRDVYLGCQQLHAPTALVLEQPTRWLDWIEQYDITLTWAPNFAFELINQCLKTTPSTFQWNLSSLKFLLNGGEAIVAKTARIFLQQLSNYQLPQTAMHPAWGMSETGSGIAYSDQFTLDATHDSQAFVEVGMPVPGTSIRITNQQKILSEGQVGAIQIKGTSVTLGYYHNPDATQAAFTPDGWFNTGDLGFLQEGQLTITGRQKDVIIINGLNYYSHEIESAVEELEGITPSYTAACAIRDSGSTTDQLALFFHPVSTEDADLLELLKTIRDQVISRIGINISYVVPLDSSAIPKTAIGKIQRSKLAKDLMAGTFDPIIKQVDILSENARTIPDWFYRTVWHRKQAIAGQRQSFGRTVLVLMDDLGVGVSVCEQLEQHGQAYVRVERGREFAQVGPSHYRVCPHSLEDMQQLCAAITRPIASLSHHSSHNPPHSPSYSISAVVHLWHYDDHLAEIDGQEHLEECQQTGLYSVLALVQAISGVQDDTHPVRLLYGASHTQRVQDTDKVAYGKSTVPGLLKSIPQEYPHWRCMHVDFPLSDSFQETGKRLYVELGQATRDMEIAYRGQQRWVAKLEKCNVDAAEAVPLSFKSGGVYLISGGLGGIGVEVATHLLQHYQARLVLLGQTALPPETEWATHQQGEQKVAEKIAVLLRLQQLGGEVIYRAVDIRNQAQVQATVRDSLAPWSGQLDGVIHLAGTYHERELRAETSDSLMEAIAPKVVGGWILHQLAQSYPEALFIHSSSLLGQFGGAMVGSYAAANSFLMGLAQHQVQQGRITRCLAWSTWTNTGMSRGYEHKYLTRAQGYMDMSVAQGINALLVGVSQPYPLLLVGLDGENANVRRFTLQSKAMEQATIFVTPHDSDEEGAVTATVERLGAISDRFGTPTPISIQSLDELPRTSDGSIDRNALAQATPHHQASTERVLPRTELEQQIAGVWQELLGIGQLSIHDNFFEMGGNSLLATQAVARLSQACAIEINVQELFEAPTIDGVAQTVEMLRRIVQDKAMAIDMAEEINELEDEYEEVL
ncbi:MAG: SDR family NAD(P)-dependent oxidoreductase [Cyanobacteria bacterium P01_F01_bin.150]